MSAKNGLQRPNTNPLTIIKSVMQQSVKYYGIQDGHIPHAPTDEVTVIIHKTRIGGTWVTYLGPYGAYQSRVNKRGDVGKPQQISDIDQSAIKARYLNA